MVSVQFRYLKNPDVASWYCQRTHRQISLTPQHSRHIQVPLLVLSFHSQNCVPNSCSCRPGTITFLLSWRSMQRRASDVTHLKWSGKGSEMFVSCVFYNTFIFPTRYNVFPQKYAWFPMSLVWHCDFFLRTPLPPTINENVVISVCKTILCNQSPPATQTQKVGWGGGQRKRRERGQEKRLTAPVSFPVRPKVTRSSHNLKQEGGWVTRDL